MTDVMVGASGTVGAKKGAELSEIADVPAAFVAVAANLYVIPGVSPVRRVRCCGLVGNEAVLLAKALLAVIALPVDEFTSIIEYEVMRAPPLLTGAFFRSTAVPNLSAVTEIMIGASGGPSGRCHLEVT